MPKNLSLLPGLRSRAFLMPVLRNLVGARRPDAALAKAEVGYPVVLPRCTHDAKRRLLVKRIKADVDGGQDPADPEVRRDEDDAGSLEALEAEVGLRLVVLDAGEHDALLAVPILASSPW